MKLTPHLEVREVLECASPLALWILRARMLDWERRHLCRHVGRALAGRDAGAPHVAHPAGRSVYAKGGRGLAHSKTLARRPHGGV